ncbi:hypothetical protein DFJ73DRAFT_27123 [Zopfochytrium polystomum]|nr:hypothetical protein DFJ73DRAFT_27123 [Zopfochytrium polystomum]
MGGRRIWYRGIYLYSFWRECAEDVVASEEKFEWRRVMADVWRAVASNPTVRSLTILSLPPVVTTAWLKPQWVHFVGQLEHLSIQLWGADNGEGLHSRTTPGYQDFFEHLTTLFFDPADGLLSLEFVASPFGTYGGDNQFFETPFTIGLSSMPRLRQLRLQNCFFDKRLLSFVQRRADTLEKIHLIEFMAAVFVSGNHRNLTWADLFDGISSAEPRKLTDFRVTMRRVPMDLIAEACHNYTSFQREAFRAIQQRLAEDEAFPLFYYGILDDKNGSVCMAPLVILKSFVKGEEFCFLRATCGDCASKSRGFEVPMTLNLLLCKTSFVRCALVPVVVGATLPARPRVC